MNVEADKLRAKIAELKEELARLEADDDASQVRLAIAHNHSLEAAVIALAVEISERLDAPDLIDSVSLRLVHTAAPALRQLNTGNSTRNADAVEGLASRLDQVPRRPKFEP